MFAHNRSHAAILALVLVVAGLTLLSGYRLAHASHAVPLPHDRNASGIPYWPGAYEISRNYTYHANEHVWSIASWNIATAPREYLRDWATGHDADEMRQYMVYSGSDVDIDLGNWFTALSGFFVPSCQWHTDVDPFASSARAFMFGHNPSNNDRLFTVICLNVTALGFPNGFDEFSLEMRIRTVMHEMGHSLHLAHDDFGIMDTCACNDIHQHEVDLINSIYLNPP